MQIVVLDEIHKYARWRTFLKGLYDKYSSKLKIIVTGSARLDYFRKGGDSLFGRYHYYRLHPFSLTEVDCTYTQKTLDRLLKFGGFPEPFCKKDSTFHRRWQLERLSRVVGQDILDLGTVKEVGPRFENMVASHLLKLCHFKEDIEGHKMETVEFSLLGHFVKLKNSLNLNCWKRD